MNIKIKIFKSIANIRKLSKLCIAGRLYHDPNWSMYYHYRNPGTIVLLGALFLENNLVCACQFISIDKSLSGDYAIGTYTLAAHRRKGIGTMLISSMYLKNPNHPKLWRPGIYGSSNFYISTLGNN